MGEKYKAPVMDWLSPGDLNQRFKLFKQKCNLVFDGPLSKKDDAYKVRMLLLPGSMIKASKSTTHTTSRHMHKL